LPASDSQNGTPAELSAEALPAAAQAAAVALGV
jgi:hypothetical protein